MAEKKEYSSEFKAKVALQALEQNKKDLEPLAKKYEVPVSLILTWAVQLEENAAGVYDASEEPVDIEYGPIPVDIEVESREIEISLKNGVMSDDLNYMRLASWSVIGLILVIVFMQMLVEIFQVNIGKHPEQVIGEDAFYEVTEKKHEAKKRLSSFGVVDKETNVYRVPVDMVIEQMAQDAEADTTNKDLLEKIDPTPVEK